MRVLDEFSSDTLLRVLHDSDSLTVYTCVKETSHNNHDRARDEVVNYRETHVSNVMGE